MKAGAYNGDNKITINNIAELNLIIDALQTSQAQVIKAAREMDRRGTPFSRMMHLKGRAQQNLLDRLRVGWKRADNIPAEIQAQLAAREDRRFWSDVQTRIDEMTLELAVGDEPVDETVLFTAYPF